MWASESTKAPSLGDPSPTHLHTRAQVPITLYFMTHAYFALYHALANVLIRKARSMVGPRSPNLRILAEAVVVFVLAYSTAYAETLTISHFPYYTHKAGVGNERGR